MITNKQPKYKVIVSDINPKRQKEIFFSHKCYLGVSLNNSFFDSKHVERLLVWISHKFPECLIIIGDALNRYNELLDGNAQDENDAIEISFKKGDLAFSVISGFIQKNKIENIQIIKHSEFMKCIKKTDFEKKKIDIINNNESIISIDKSVKEYLRRRNIEPNQKNLSLSTKYILEELIIFDYLIKSGYPVQVYPGTHLPILKDTANGVIQLPNDILANGAFLDLSVKKVK